MKKLFALVLALALTVLSVAAFAADSKTTNNLTYVAPVVPEETEETEETVEIEVVPEENSEVVAELVEEFASKPANDVVLKIENSEEQLEATAELVELMEINVTGAEAGETGTITATLTVPTEIKEGAAVRVLVLVDGKWYEVPSKVTEDGTVEVELSEEILLLLQGEEHPVIAVFTV